MIGYARVSTKGQSLEAQISELQAAGCIKVFREHATGAHDDRPQLRRALAALDPEDVLVVTRLDRLARSSRDLLNIAEQIEKRGARMKSLADPWADTTTPMGRLMLTVLGGLAEFERSLIIARTTEGRARAKAKGRRLGRPPKLNKAQEQAAREWRAEGKTHAEIAELVGVARSTISRFFSKT